MKIIGFSGKSGSGKDTGADNLQTLLSVNGYAAKLFSFAIPLKDIVNACCGFQKNKDSPAYTIDGKEYTPGEMYQIVGQGIRQAIPGFFANRLRHWINTKHLNTVTSGANIGNTYYTDPDYLIITDVRFINEAQLIRDMGGKIVRIHRNVVSLRPQTHISETEMDTLEFRDLVNFDIYNHGDLAAFYKSIKALYTAIVE